MRFRMAFVLALCAAPALAQTPAPGVSTESFRVSTVAQLAQLCATPSTDRGYAEAMGFCHGYASGAVDYHRASTRAGAAPLFCVPPPEPTFEQVRTKFVAWAGANPQRGAMRTADGLFTFLRDTFPCPRAATPAARR